jgi:putative oxidoreductase
MINAFLQLLFLKPKKIAGYLTFLAPLLARLVVGYVFMMSGWGKLNHLPAMIEQFIEWQIPFAHIMTPFVAGFEFIGGIFLMLGLLTRIVAAGLAIVMIVAIQAVKWVEVDSWMTFLGFEETTYWVVFFWLAIAGAGAFSVDHWLENRLKND